MPLHSNKKAFPSSLPHPGGSAGVPEQMDEKKASSKAGLAVVRALNSNESASVFVILDYQLLGPLSSRPVFHVLPMRSVT
jgi:hypothetical protein